MALERRERKDAQRNLERVLQAAHQLFAEHGPDVTMEDVARQAGVGVGTIYRRFASKEQLFAAVSRAVCADMRHCLYQAAEEAPDPVSKLRALVVLQYRRNAQQAALIDLAPANQDDDTVNQPGADQQQLYEMLHTILSQIIADGQRQQALRSGDPALLAALCLELLSPRAFRHVARLSNGDADAVAQHVVAFLLTGLGARG